MTGKPMSMDDIQKIVAEKKLTFNDFTLGDYVYQGSPHPGMICKLYRDGTREHGHFYEREFHPEHSLTEKGEPPL